MKEAGMTLTTSEAIEAISEYSVGDEAGDDI